MDGSLFLETTVQAERILGTRTKKEAVKRNTAGKTLVSSKTVLGEFINTFVHTAVVFHNLLVDSPNTAEALQRLESYQERKAKRAMKLLGTVAKERGWDKEDVLDHLDMFVEWGLVHMFEHGLAAIVVGTDCAKARARPIKRDSAYALPIPGLSCQKNAPPECSAGAFLSTHREALLDVVANLDPKDDEQRRMIETGPRVADGTENPFGQTCMNLKDIIIALEAPAESAVYTTNIKHFAPICEALGKQLHKEH